MSTNGQSPATKEDLANLRAEMAGEMANFRGEVRQDMANFREEMRQDMANFRGEMHQEMVNFREEMHQEMANFREEMRQEMAKLRDELLEAVSKLVYESETRLLNAFYGFAESNRKQIADLTRSDSSLRERLDTVEDRLLEIEKRLNFPQRPSPPPS